MINLLKVSTRTLPNWLIFTEDHNKTNKPTKFEITKLRYARLHDLSSYISTACHLDIAFPLSWGLQSQQRNRVHKFVRRVSGMVGARSSCNSRGRRHGKCHPRGGRGVSTVGCGSQGSSSVIVLEKAKKRDGCHVGDRQHDTVYASPM